MVILCNCTEPGFWRFLKFTRDKYQGNHLRYQVDWDLSTLDSVIHVLNNQGLILKLVSVISVQANVILLIITIAKFSNLIGYQLSWFQQGQYAPSQRALKWLFSLLTETPGISCVLI